MNKRILSFLLALLMVLSMFPGGVFANNDTVPETTSATETVPETTASTVETIPETTAETIPETTGAAEPVETAPALLPEQEDLCPCCEETLAEDGTILHTDICTAAYVYDGTSDVGRYTQLSASSVEYGVEISGDPVNEGSLLFFWEEFQENTVLKITDWHWDPATTAIWYRVEFYSGGILEELLEYWPETPWVLHDYSDTNYDFAPALEFVTVEEPENVCPICGNADCTALHFYCSICDAYDCGKPHLYCSTCGIFDCTEDHVWCGRCGEFDCGLEHEELYLPVVAPVLPEEPVLTEGDALVLADESGDPVSGSVLLTEGRKTSLSAWSDLENPAYQWQVRYDAANDLWVDIQGQTGQDILMSPAMFRSLLDREGSAALRCVMSTAEETRTGEAGSVVIAPQTQQVAFAHVARAAVASDIALAAEDMENKVSLIVNYKFTDGSVASNPWTASLPFGAAYENTGITVPVIAGYAPSVDVGSDGASLTDYNLSLSFTAEQMSADRVEVNIIYQPVPVTVKVRHYWQNVTDDDYTLHESETISLKTGTEVGNVHKDYEGFYHLLYEHPIVAADGSTEVEVRYDREYYLMKFELDGGYGVLPIYARYGTAITVNTPVKAGYTFAGWLDAQGNLLQNADISAIPVGGGTYTAQWTPKNGIQYTVAYWIVNDDGTRSLIGTHINKGIADGKVSGEGDLHTSQGYICNEESEHSHSAVCYSCGLEQHAHLNSCYGTLEVNSPGNGVQAIEALGSGEPESGYVYAVYTHTHNTYWPKLYLVDANGNGEYYSVNGIGGGTDTSSFSSIVEGGPLAEKTTTVNGETLTVTKYKARITCNDAHHAADCQLTCSQHAHSEDCYADTTYLQYKDSVTVTRADGTTVTYSTDKNVKIKGDGTSVVNVYYQYKEYTLKFYYAATEGGSDTNGDGINDNGFSSIKIVGGTTYYFGSRGPDTTDDEELLENQYWNYSDQWGTIKALPTLNARGESRNYEKGAVTYSHTVDNTVRNITYHYISFKARYGDDISGMWPCAVFNSATRTSIANNTNGWTGTEAFVSAWNGEDHVKYSRDNSNQTIKGVYEKLDENLLFHSGYTEEYDEVSYICFWENGCGNITWNYPMLFRYNIYLETYSGQDLSQETVVTRNGKTYYRADSYDTCDNSNVNEQTHVSLTGYDKDGRTSSKLTNFDKTLYKDAFEVNFFYNAQVYKLSFWNHDGFLTDGTGTMIPYKEPLAKRFNGSTVDGVTYKGATQRAEESYPDSLEPDAYEFAGWYTSAMFTEDTKVDPETLTMPAEPLMLYAYWKPKEYMVTIHIEQDGQIIDTIVEVPHGSSLDEMMGDDLKQTLENPTPPEGKEGYDFVNWFFKDEKGIEQVFDPANTSVNRNLNIYAKWTMNVLCRYEFHFVLASDETVAVADPIIGSGLAGNSVTENAKGGSKLKQLYQDGYFPDVESHTITLVPVPEEGENPNVFVFRYTALEAVPYTVKYLKEGTDEELIPSVSYPDNTKAVVTENFVPISGYLPVNSEYQKTLVVVPGSEDNVIVFYYEEDDQHALYQVNYLVQNLDGKTWSEYKPPASITGDIGKEYSVTAESITGFVFSDTDTAMYNRNYTDLNGNNYPNGINAATNWPLRGQVSFDPDTDTVTGTLTDQGMQLNLYYVRQEYTYTAHYLEYGTDRVLHDPKTGTAKYGAKVTEYAETITIDLDGDGKPEDFQLYDATQDPQTATIVDNNTVFTFYYVRCTQDLQVTKQVTKKKPDTDPVFDFVLTLHANDFHQTGYAYEIHKNGTVSGNGYLYPQDDGQNWPTLSFSLKDGETITIKDLPTAEYTVAERNLPLGYYAQPKSTDVTLTKDTTQSVTVTNTYEPANLEISKWVNEVEVNNQPEVDEFDFTIQVPAGVTGELSYVIVGSEYAHRTVPVADGAATISLRHGQTARFENLPLGDYTVTEADYTALGYKSLISLNGAAATEGCSVAVTMNRKETQTVQFRNDFPVGDLKIQKTVTKEYAATPWEGDTFTFTIDRTNKPLNGGNRYSYDLDGVRQKVTVDGVEQDAAVVVDAGKITVTITFTPEEAAKLGTELTSLTHTVTVNSLPAGTYSVTETADADYDQSPLKVENLKIPAQEAPAAEFTNQLIRPTGSLYLKKELERAEGYVGELDENMDFRFTVELQDEWPESAPIQITKGESTTDAVLNQGKVEVTLKKGENLTISGLPIGSYRIVEATVPRYANDFAHRINGEWKKQDSMATQDGSLYTTVQVKKDSRFEVKCTNTYPVDRSELIIQKLVTKENDLDTLPEDSFTFTVTLAEDDFNSYAYKVYGGETVMSLTAQVQDKSFAITLKNGEYAVIPGMPVCGYTITETVSLTDYDTSYQVYLYATGATASTSVNTSGTPVSGTGAVVTGTFSAGKTNAVVFTNQYKSHRTSLTINQSNASDPEQVFVYKVVHTDGSTYTVTVRGQGRTTIHDLPYGDYTVTQVNDWSWRHTESAKSVTLEAGEASEVTFGNSYKHSNWLDGNSNRIVNRKKEEQNEP